MPRTVKYRAHKGRVFKIVTTWQDAIRLAPEQGYEINRSELRHWAARRLKHAVYSIRLDNGVWRYCFANVDRKHVKKWLDYFSALY